MVEAVFGKIQIKVDANHVCNSVVEVNSSSFVPANDVVCFQAHKFVTR